MRPGGGDTDPDSPPPRDGPGVGLHAASYLLAGLVVGGVAGYGLDTWLGTRPWLMLAGVCAGFCAGVMNVVRLDRRTASRRGGQGVPASSGNSEHNSNRNTTDQGR